MVDRSCMRTLAHDGPVRGYAFSRDESRVLTWSDDKTARLWDVTKPEPIQTFKHDDSVRGAQFSRDESRVLTWSGKFVNSIDEVRLWSSGDPLAMLTPAERILELEVRSAMTLDANLKLRTLSFAEWQAKVQSPEYRAIEQKLPQHK